MVKLTFDSKELTKVIKFVASIATRYSLDKGETNVKVVAGKKSKLIYASKGTYLEVKMPIINVEKEGEFVVDAYYLENLPTRAKETTIEVEKDKEGSFTLSYSNGKNKGDLIIANDVDGFNRQIIESSEFPSKFINLSKEQLAKTVNNAMYNSTDNEMDKSVGLPIKIISKGKEATIYTGDKNSALIYNITLKEKAEKCEILTQGMLIKDTFSFASDSIDFSSNDTYTRVKSKDFDLVVPTQELVLFNLEDFFEKHSKVVASITFDIKDMINALEDVKIISNIANIDSRFNIVYKDGKATILNKANVGKAKSVFKAKGKKEFNLYSYAEWFLNFSSNFSGNVTLDIMPQVAVLKSEDSGVKAILPIME